MTTNAFDKKSPPVKKNIGTEKKNVEVAILEDHWVPL
jgi:hypothetical protein